METISSPLLLATALLSPIITLILGVLQARNQSSQAKIEERLKDASSAKTYGEAWEKLTQRLQADIDRIRAEADEKEREFLEQIDVLKIQMQKAEREWNLEKVTLRDRIAELERQNKDLRTDLEHLKKDTGELKEKKGESQ